MGSRWIPRLAVAAVVGVSAWWVATPAWADTNPVLNQTNVFADKTKFGQCTEKPNQSPTEDIWVFVWPGKEAGDLVHLTLNFDSDGDNVADAQRTEADATKTLDQGTLKAWVSTPAGWKLINGTSQITGSVPQNQFQLTHSCGGTPTTPTPSPSGSSSPSSSPSGGDGSSPPGSTPGDGGSSSGGSGGGLPVTGAAVTGMVAAGLAMVATGIVLLAVRRRRSIVDFEA